MNEIDALAESQINDPHYLQSVTNLGDTRPIIANREIYSSTGMKLISAGMHINSSLYGHLLQHKLAPPLDQCLSTEDTVTGAGLVEKAMAMLKDDKRLALTQSAHADGQTLPLILKQVPLNPAIAFKLTVMRETNAELFQHSLYVAIVSTYIGIQLQMEKNQLIDLATAALLHDIGMLHVDPKLLAHGHKMTETERRHLYVHSVTGWMILTAYPEYKKKVLDGILQHHERLDGSGYPRGLKSGEIGQFGQIIAVAEIVASRFGGDDDEYGWSRLETILKLNLRRYGSDLVRYLKAFYHEKSEPPPCSESDKQAAQEKLTRISRIFTSWESTQKECDNKDPVHAYINERMASLKLEVIDAGLYLDVNDEKMLGFQEDSKACFDAMILLDETLWQLRNIIREIRRRWPSIDKESPMQDLSAMSSWMKEVELLM
jgi:hypothetical protein